MIAANRRFGTVYADPPWPYDNTTSRGAAENNYRTMRVDAIADLPVAKLAAAEAHLHHWTTNGFLFEARQIIEAWGRVSPGPRLELFARTQSDGWTTWGNQIQRSLFDDLQDEARPS